MPHDDFDTKPATSGDAGDFIGHGEKEAASAEMLIAADEDSLTRRDDVRRNNPQTVASRDIEINECGINNDRSEIPLDEKVLLAIQVSVATIPGACHSNATTSDRSRSKPSLTAQWRELARLRAVQKDRQNDQNPDRGLDVCPSDEAYPIDELQGRMNDLHEGVLAENAEDAEKRKTLFKKCVIKLVLLAIALIVSGVAVGASLGLQEASSENEDVAYYPPIVQPSSTPSIDASRCILADTNDEMTERFLTYHDTILVNFPRIATLVDLPGSVQRSALCWIAYLDLFEVAEDTIVQRFILVLIYRQFESSPVDDATQVMDLANQNWLTDLHECSWGRIECTPDNEVSKLRLGGLGLSGKFPTEIALLTKLVHLDFTFNSLTGKIPAELWSMKQLEDLRVSVNQLTGTVSNSIANLSELKRVDIGRNWFSGTIPDLGTLSSLTSLSVFDNSKISGTFPDLSMSTNLGALQLTYIDLSGTIPDYLWSHTSLSVLGLRETFLSGTIPTDIGNLQKLEMFLISHCRFSGTIPTELGRSSHLAYLSLENNLFSGTLPTEICALTSSSLVEIIVADGILCDCCTLNGK